MNNEKHILATSAGHNFIVSLDPGEFNSHDRSRAVEFPSYEAAETFNAHRQAHQSAIGTAGAPHYPVPVQDKPTYLADCTCKPDTCGICGGAR